jgi:hypothetical protein
VTTGDDYTCEGEAGETVCVWYRVPHIAVSTCNDTLLSRTMLTISSTLFKTASQMRALASRLQAGRSGLKAQYQKPGITIVSEERAGAKAMSIGSITAHRTYTSHLLVCKPRRSSLQGVLRKCFHGGVDLFYDLQGYPKPIQASRSWFDFGDVIEAVKYVSPCYYCHNNRSWTITSYY